LLDVFAVSLHELGTGPRNGSSTFFVHLDHRAGELKVVVILWVNCLESLSANLLSNRFECARGTFGGIIPTFEGNQ
jgi:hypothetical protein